MVGGVPEISCHSVAEPERGLDENVGVVQSFGERGRLEQRVAVFGLCRLALDGTELGEEFGAFAVVGWDLAVDEVEGLLIPADGVVGGERVAGGVAGAADVAERFVEIGGAGGGDPVVGELGERRGIFGRGSGFESFGDALVGTSTAVRAELVVEAVLDQPVGEPIPVGGAALDQHRGADRGVEEVQEWVFADIGESGEEVEVELAADHRGEAQDAEGFVAEAFDAPADDVADTGREAELFELAGEGPAAVGAEDDPTRLAEVAEQLAR